MSVSTSLSLYFRTVKHLRPSQLYWRIRNKGVREFYSKFPGFLTSSPIFSYNKVLPPIQGNLRKLGYNSKEETFTFLNQSRKWEREWFPKDAELLWLFNLHYFEFSFGLSPEEFTDFVESWIKEVPKCHKVAWHSYPLSKRIVNWIWYISQNEKALSEEFKRKCLSSIKSQQVFLRRTLEYDLLGNHLLTNLTSLTISAVFTGDDNLLSWCLKALESEVEEQILPDGGHFELSPMYHSLALVDLLSVYSALTEPPAWLRRAIEKMSSFLSLLTGNGYSLPLLNDSSTEIALQPDDILKTVRSHGMELPEASNGPTLLKESGLFIYTTPKLRFIFDLGAVGPDYQPGHSHNDQLSILLDFGDIPFLTDSGVYTYKDTPDRHYFRSVASHNTIMADGIEPNEIWKSFRLGRRGYVSNVEFNQETLEVKGRLKTYNGLKLDIIRSVKLLNNDEGIEITNTIDNSRCKLPIIENYHLSPDLKLNNNKIENGLRVLTFESGGKIFYMGLPQSIETDFENSFYSPEFGKKIERLKIINSFRHERYLTWKVVITTNRDNLKL